MVAARACIALLATSLLPSPPVAVGCAVRREAVSLRLGDFDSPAEIVKPPEGTPLRGVVVLFAGSDIADMDGAIVGADDGIISRPLRQVAERLACGGIASVRYNKRYVTGPYTADRARFDQLSGKDLAADGRAALALARARPELARLPVALFGWSEGSTVAMAVAATDRGIRAIVLMAPVVDSMAATAQRQYGRIGRPYLMHYATDGSLDADAIARADAGPGGVLAHVFVRMFRGFRPGEKVNPLLDTDKNGRISFAEADPIIRAWYADTPNGGLGMSATGRALPGVSAAFRLSTPQMLILQGRSDAMIDPASARAFAREARTGGRVTLKLYARLGHSLGRADSPSTDGLLPTAGKPLDDMITWLDRLMAEKREAQ